MYSSCRRGSGSSDPAEGLLHFLPTARISLPVVLMLGLVVSPVRSAPVEVPADKPAVPWPVRIPDRSPDAITGSQFAERTAGLTGRARQQAAVTELRQGNIPGFLRSFKPVRLTHKSPDGELLEALVWVAPDYLAIGSDDDFLRIPLTYPSTVAIAQEFGCFLPTAKIVDAIYQESDCKIRPQFLPPGKQMRSSEYYLKHHRLIEAQRVNCSPEELTAGEKKDVVLSNRLRRAPNRIAIYGWHRENGAPVQPLSIVHGSRYADYSHGIRLISRTVWINGQPRPVADVLGDPFLAPLLTYEGRISDAEKLLTIAD